MYHDCYHETPSGRQMYVLWELQKGKRKTKEQKQLTANHSQIGGRMWICKS
jgi:hypothetical protein